jgi:hypothetical protein
MPSLPGDGGGVWEAGRESVNEGGYDEAINRHHLLERLKAHYSVH